MVASEMVRLIRMAGGIHLAIVGANFSLPRRLRVQRNLAPVPNFLRQVFYVHWLYIVLIVALFAALCFGFAPELAGGSTLGRFLSAFIAGFWLLRMILQWLFYDRQVRRDNTWLDAAYSLALVTLTGVFSFAAFRPMH
jgi:hypothetical protein